MAGPARRPLLFLDVDGPLLPFGAARCPTFPPPPDAGGNPLLERIDPAHGQRLAALPCELVWATTWMADANACVAPRLGLPALEVLAWPESAEHDEHDERVGLHWKTRALVDRAGGRPFAWVDDEITAVDRAWVAAHHGGPVLLQRVDHRLGLTGADYAALDAWLRGAGVAAGG